MDKQNDGKPDDGLIPFRATCRRKALQETFHVVHDAPYDFVSEESIRQADWKSLKTKECIFRYGGEFLTKTILNKFGKVSDVELLS